MDTPCDCGSLVSLLSADTLAGGQNRVIDYYLDALSACWL